MSNLAALSRMEGELRWVLRELKLEDLLSDVECGALREIPLGTGHGWCGGLFVVRWWVWIGQERFFL